MTHYYKFRCRGKDSDAENLKKFFFFFFNFEMIFYYRFFCAVFIIQDIFFFVIEVTTIFNNWNSIYLIIKYGCIFYDLVQINLLTHLLNTCIYFMQNQVLDCVLLNFYASTVFFSSFSFAKTPVIKENYLINL